MMNIHLMKDCAAKVQRLGRTFEGPDMEIFMNWTCSGIRFAFTGTCLIAGLRAICGEEEDRSQLDGTIVKRKTWPYVAVFLDDNYEPIRYFEVNDTLQDYLLYSSEQEETHIITIRKMTENPKGKLGICNLQTDGMIDKAFDEIKKMKLEFIGDSITCGFGNMTNERDRVFYSAEENGWLSHPAIAAKKLDADFSMICYSGIPISKGIGLVNWLTPSMPELYPYTDRLMEEHCGINKQFKNWNFEHDTPDVIILNLGTNDATVIDINMDMDMDIELGIRKFEEDYYAFLQMIRDLNTNEPWIICALGSMDYFLYDNIQKVVQRYVDENHDKKIRCFKYSRIRLSDGYGACGHPGIATQTRMGNELADFILDLVSL